MDYIVYDETGEIVSWGSCDTPPAPGDGLTLVEATASGFTHYISNNALTAYTPEQAAIKAATPEYPCHWSNATFSWIDDRDLNVARQAQWDTIKADRDAEIYGGLVWDGSTFDTDMVAQSRISGACTLALMAVVAGQAGAFSKTWKLADNTTRVLSATQMMAVGVALGQMVQAAIDKGQVLLLQVGAASSSEQIRSIQWS